MTQHVAHRASDEIAELKRENQRLIDALEEARGKPRERTHGEGCWVWGRSHYECALAQLAELRAQLEMAKAALHKIASEVHFNAWQGEDTLTHSAIAARAALAELEGKAAP